MSSKKVPVSLVLDIVIALSTALATMLKEEVTEIEADNINEVIRKVMDHHPESQVDTWIMSQMRWING